MGGYRNRIIGGLVGVTLLAGCTTATQTRRLERRISQLERSASNQGVVELMNQMQALQSEVQQLRGETEAVNHRIEEFEKKQQALYLDLDRRMLAMEGRAAPLPSAEPSDSDSMLSGDVTDPLAEGQNDALAQSDTGPVAPETEPPDSDSSLYTETPVAEPAQSSPSLAPATGASNEQAAYDNVFATLSQGRYDTAIEQFNEFLATYPNGPNADNAQYWLGEAYYVTRNFSAAQDGFQKVLDNFPTSVKAPDALLKLGFIEYERGDWVAARNILYDVIKRYPQSNAARLAEKRLSRMKNENR